ncbi:MAG TPA: adenine phosphoribosyltransferase [Fibrobacteres bacterium]|jgi:adenine phosphoribosyltransferase|nr:adenine phosphoribosyltransferase [Fibrobacterota bacterium]
MSNAVDLIRSKIRDVPDFPKPGILFRDITPLWKDGTAFEACMGVFSDRYPFKSGIVVAGIESRGFVVGSAFAARHSLGFVPIRKKGKLPADVESHEYELEYGSDCVEIHRDAVHPGQKVLIMDDLLATGGTMLAAIHLLKKIGADVAGCAVVIDLPFLGGRKKIESAGYEVFSILDY